MGLARVSTPWAAPTVSTGACDRWPVDNVTQLPLDRDIIAKQLKAGGYVTGMFGKWHIGERGDYFPGKRGFDEAIVTAGKHFDFVTEPKTDYPDGQYLADFDRQGRGLYHAAQG